jgi:hypothetical protein
MILRHIARLESEVVEPKYDYRRTLARYPLPVFIFTRRCPTTSDASNIHPQRSSSHAPDYKSRYCALKRDLRGKHFVQEAADGASEAIMSHFNS